MLPSLVLTFQVLVTVAGVCLFWWSERQINQILKGCHRIRISLVFKGTGALCWASFLFTGVEFFVLGSVLVGLGFGLRWYANRAGCDVFGCEE